jgi:hypothetical protein
VSAARYLYLCYTKDPTSGKAIEDVNVIAGDLSDPPIQAGWGLIKQDLNEGAGGEYVYIVFRPSK